MYFIGWHHLGLPVTATILNAQGSVQFKSKGHDTHPHCLYLAYRRAEAIQN